MAKEDNERYREFVMNSPEVQHIRDVLDYFSSLSPKEREEFDRELKGKLMSPVELWAEVKRRQNGIN
jgi:hypothetical protein